MPAKMGFFAELIIGALRCCYLSLEKENRRLLTFTSCVKVTERAPVEYWTQ